MRTSGLIRIIALTLVFSFLTYTVVASNERAGLSRPSDNGRSATYAEELSLTSEGPVKIEKFILKTAKSHASSATSEDDGKSEEKPEARPASDNVSTQRSVNLAIPAQPLFTPASRELSLIDKTYLDAYLILRETNSCSQFFGGPRIATGVLNSLHPRLKTASSENHVGIIMFGPVTSVTDVETGARYRLFKQALVNIGGPFYRSADYQSSAFFHRIGRYPANTREARVTMLLHELGHLLPNAGGGWLLPDDWGNRAQIADNTETVMLRCGEQIESLSRR